MQPWCNAWVKTPLIIRRYLIRGDIHISTHTHTYGRGPSCLSRRPPQKKPSIKTLFTIYLTRIIKIVISLSMLQYVLIFQLCLWREKEEKIGCYTTTTSFALHCWKIGQTKKKEGKKPPWKEPFYFSPLGRRKKAKQYSLFKCTSFRQMDSWTSSLRVTTRAN